MTTERINRTTASQPVAGAAVGTGKPAACKRYRNPARGAAVVVCWPCSNATGRDTLAGVVRERFGPVRCRQSLNKQSAGHTRLSRLSCQRRNPSFISCVEPRSARVSQAGMVSGEIPERVRALLPMKHLLGAISTPFSSLAFQSDTGADGYDVHQYNRSRTLHQPWRSGTLSDRPVSSLHDTLRAGLWVSGSAWRCGAGRSVSLHEKCSYVRNARSVHRVRSRLNVVSMEGL